MKIRTCSSRKILKPCSLNSYEYQIDPYIGCEHHCYYCYALNQAETEWTEEILIHQDFTNQLNSELSKLEPQPIYFGWNSDPYQPAESTYHHTRQSLELLAERGFSVCILTKSDLVTRDIDILASMPESTAGFSIAIQDEDVRQIFEVNAPSNSRRVKALQMLKNAGIKTYILICPVMPFITDVEYLIEIVEPYADTIWLYSLSMESEGDRNWQCTHNILDQHFPELTEAYRQIAFSSDHPYWTELRQRLQAIQIEKQLNLRIEL